MSYLSPSPMSAGMKCVCPRCGQGKLFKGYLTVVDTCEVCGLKLAENDSGDGPAVFLVFVLGAVVVGAALWVEATFEPPYWLHLVIWPVVILGLTLASMRPLKAYVVALQFRHRRSDFEGS